MSLPERRRSPRFPFHANGQVVLGALEIGGAVMDLSACGVLFSTGCEVADMLGERCQLKVVIDTCQTAVVLEGVVVSQRRELVGIAFGEVTGTARTALERVIDMNLGMPQLLDRDVPALFGQQADDDVREKHIA